MLAAVQQDGGAFLYVIKELQKDEEVILAARNQIEEEEGSI